MGGLVDSAFLGKVFQINTDYSNSTFFYLSVDRNDKKTI